MASKIPVDNLLSAIRVVRNSQKGQVSKIFELDAKVDAMKDFETRLNRLEEVMEKEMDASVTRVDDVNNQLEGFGNVIDAHIDSITELEEHKKEIVSKLEAIDKYLEKNNVEMRKFDEDIAVTKVDLK